MWLHSLKYLLILYLLLRKSGKELRDDVIFYVIIHFVFSSTFNSMNHRPPTAFCSLVMGGWCSSYVLSWPFFFTVSCRLLIMSFYYFCFALPKLRTSDYHNHIDCLMCYEWALKITNSTVPTFLKSIISIKSDFYVLSLYKNYYYQIRPTITNFPQVNNRLKPEFYVLELKMLVAPRPGLYDADANSIFQSYMRPVAFTKYHLPQQLWPYYFYSTNGALLF